MAGSEKHASQLVASEAPYRLELQPSPSEPILTIYAEAPSVGSALRLANSATLGLSDYLRSVAQQQGFPIQELPQLRPLGSPRGGVTNSRAKIEIAGLTFITAFALSFVALLLLLRRRWRGPERDVSRPPRRSRLTGRAAADWPRTTRLLPWSIAGLIAMIWLTPFDRLQLGGGGTPINITLDRVVIPIVAVIWLIAFTAGPGAAPRLKVTRVHVAMGAYLACAFLSVVLDAHYLNHTGELAISVKKVPLLVSYMSIFVIVASSIRRSEVPAFMSFTLGLAVIVGLEAIYEYHTHQDLFLTLLGHLGPFKLSAADTTNATALDSLGRFDLQGPTDYGAELVGILTMALSIALLRFLKAKSVRQRILYGRADRPPALRDVRHRAEDVAARAGDRLPDDRVLPPTAASLAGAPATRARRRGDRTLADRPSATSSPSSQGRTPRKRRRPMRARPTSTPSARTCGAICSSAAARARTRRPPTGSSTRTSSCRWSRRACSAWRLSC